MIQLGSDNINYTHPHTPTPSHRHLLMLSPPTPSQMDGDDDVHRVGRHEVLIPARQVNYDPARMRQLFYGVLFFVQSQEENKKEKLKVLLSSCGEQASSHPHSLTSLFPHVLTPSHPHCFTSSCRSLQTLGQYCLLQTRLSRRHPRTLLR